MAKLVDTTWAACLARQNPVSTRAKPACMKMTSTAPMTIHSRLVCCPRAVTASAGIGVLRAGDARSEEDQGAREGQPQSCFPPERHAGSRVTTRANGHGYVFLSDVPGERGLTPMSDPMVNVWTGCHASMSHS